MSGERSETTYRFAPHPSAGFILGLRIAQLAGLIVAGALALASLRAGGFGRARARDRGGGRWSRAW